MMKLEVTRHVVLKFIGSGAKGGSTVVWHGIPAVSSNRDIGNLQSNFSSRTDLLSANPNIIELSPLDKEQRVARSAETRSGSPRRAATAARCSPAAREGSSRP